MPSWARVVSTRQSSTEQRTGQHSRGGERRGLRLTSTDGTIESTKSALGPSSHGPGICPGGGPLGRHGVPWTGRGIYRGGACVAAWGHDMSLRRVELIRTRHKALS